MSAAPDLEPTTHVIPEQLRTGLDHVRFAPADAGTLELIAARPAEEERKLMEAGRALNLRGFNTRVVEAGAIRQGDVVRKVNE
ncbi:MAG: hypothetical protein M3383_02640 [Actinomycetota bacterium]|nr:hypothetical protein [Actinomycetota bacterium]